MIPFFHSLIHPLESEALPSTMGQKQFSASDDTMIRETKSQSSQFIEKLTSNKQLHCHFEIVVVELNNNNTVFNSRTS